MIKGTEIRLKIPYCKQTGLHPGKEMKRARDRKGEKTSSSHRLREAEHAERKWEEGTGPGPGSATERILDQVLFLIINGIPMPFLGRLQ